MDTVASQKAGNLVLGISDLSRTLRNIVWAASHLSDGYSVSVGVSGGFPVGEISQCLAISSFPSRSEEPGELVRIYWNGIRMLPLFPQIHEMLIAHLSPPIEGVGHVTLHERNDGWIIRLRDDGNMDGVHEHRS